MRIEEARLDSGARSDEELMAAVQEGDLEQLGVLFTRHHVRTHALCFRLTGSADAADDLTQGVFLRVLKYRRTFDARSAFRSWLYRIAYNAAVEHRRLAAARAESALGDDVAAEPGSTALDDRHDLLQRALARLPADKRDVLVMSRFEQLTYREIAELLGCTEGTARVRAHRALEELREICRTLEMQTKS